MRRFIFDDRTIATEVTREIAERSVGLFQERGFGLWLACLRPPTAHDVIVGFGAFWYFRDPPELELMYGVDDAHVARGYGFEIAQAVVQYGFDVLRMPLIRASTDADNLASQRVLDRLTFAFERRAVVNGLDTLFYTRQNPSAGGISSPDAERA